MAEMYFITGFLGAGKTTFVKKFINFFSDKKIAIIVNEFGKTGIDGELLSTLGTVVEEISNGSIMCSCRIFDFESTLNNVLQKNAPDVIIVEASGLTDPTNIKKFLLGNENFSTIDFKGCICLVDAINFKKVIKTASVCKKQLAVSDVVIVNKIDLAVNNEVTDIHNEILSLYPEITIVNSSFGEVDNTILNILRQTQQKTIEINSENTQSADITLKKYLLKISEKISLYSLKKLLEMIANEAFRIKGFARLSDNEIYHIDCVQNIVKINKIIVSDSHLQEIVILSGKGMNTSTALKKAKEWYGEFIEKIEKC